MSQIVNIYPYRDRYGELLYEVVRYDPKDFRQRRPEGESYVWNLDGVQRVVYLLPELLDAPVTATVYFVEGEKDVHTLMREGFVATCIAGGANAPWSDNYTEVLKDRNVVLLPDSDTPGRLFMERVQSHLPHARVVHLPNLPIKGDVTDFFNAGGTKEQFLKAVNDSITASSQLFAEVKALPPKDVQTLSDVDGRPMNWLWKPWLPEGKLCLLDGDPGQGKSYVTLDLAARLSTGRPFPDGEANLHGPQKVLLISCEDGLADTIVPRLRALGADLSKCFSYRGPLSEGEPTTVPKYPEDLPVLQGIVQKLRPKLVVIDPLMAFLGKGVNAIDDKSVRSELLAPLAALADRTGATFLFVRHLNKSGGKMAIYRGGGSIGIIGAMRSSWLIGRHPHDAESRVLSIVKNNLAKEPKSLVFHLAGDEERTTVAWDGSCDLRANDLVGDVKAQKPAEWLASQLEDGERAAAAMLDLARQAGYSESTMKRAKKDLGVLVRKIGNAFFWRLPTTSIRRDSDAYDEYGLKPLDCDLPPLR